jgi:hypothetical protein
MKKIVGRAVSLALVVALGACVYEPLPRPYYASPAPPPLQPYMGPPFVAAASVRHVVKRHYRKRHRRVRCRCETAR